MREDDGVYKLPFLGTASAAALSPEHLSGGMATPPLHALASVPFKWEEQPGKARPCTDIIVRPEPDMRCLELPPSRKMASPTTVLDGPYNLRRPKFSSFRLFREKQSSFDSSSSSPQSHQSQSYVNVLVGKKSDGRLKMNRYRLFSRSLREKRRAKKDADDDEGSFGFSPASFAGFDSSSSVFVEGKMTRNSSYSHSHSHSQAAAAAAASTPLWVSMYRRLKLAISWKRTTKSQKQGAR